MKLLIKSCYNWADEADFPSWTILEEDKFEEIKKTLVDYFEHPASFEIIVGVGTNEDIEFNSAEAVLGGLAIHKLTDEEYNTLLKLFGHDYGECTLSRVYEYVQEAFNELDEVEIEDEDLE